MTGCINRYTRAFFLPDTVPDSLPYLNDKAVTNRLPEPFGPWQVEIAMVSVFQSSDYDRVQSNEYNVDIRFRLPRDSVRNLYGMPMQTDTIPRFVHVDTLNVVCQPSGKSLVVPAKQQRSRHDRGVGFHVAGIPKDDDAVTLTFTARMIDLDGAETYRREYECSLVKFEEKRQTILSDD